MSMDVYTMQLWDQWCLGVGCLKCTMVDRVCLVGVVSEEMYSVCICDWVCLVRVSEEVYTISLPDWLTGVVWMSGWCGV